MKQSLYHEYIQRHHLKLPLVSYSTKTNVILRQKTKRSEKPVWRILSLNWRPQDYHPSFFEVNYLEAIHNGFNNNKCFKDILRSDTWYWDQYEINLLNIIKEIKNQEFFAQKTTENILAAWEMFVFLTDSYLADKFDYDFFQLLEKSIYKSYSLRERKLAFKKVENLLEKKDPTIWDFWQHRIKPISCVANNQWLVHLINEKL